MTLKQFAAERYFHLVTNNEWRENFLVELEKREVIDKQEDGYHCPYCKKFSKDAVAFPEICKIIFPKDINEIWIVNSHYCGCRGWE